EAKKAAELKAKKEAEAKKAAELKAKKEAEEKAKAEKPENEWLFKKKAPAPKRKWHDYDMNKVSYPVIY
ncbi:MAG: hypothetical protein IKM17_05690, partial [Lentisphaeria bacterium]|nr:hypothetical protein [Lentisphaeria bacterium]